jgi:hypothetical protein
VSLGLTKGLPLPLVSCFGTFESAQQLTGDDVLVLFCSLTPSRLLLLLSLLAGRSVKVGSAIFFFFVVVSTRVLLLLLTTTTRIQLQKKSTFQVCALVVV